MEEKKSRKKAGVSVGTIIAIFAIAFILIFSMPSPRLVNEDGSWQIIWSGNLVSAAENNPGAGATGFLEFFVINHTASPDTVYAQNTSTTLETWCDAVNLGYASADEFNIEIAHSVTFDLLCKVRFNKTHAWNGTAFIDSDTRVNITCTGDVTIADETGTNVVGHNDSGLDYIWINVYWDNSGSGYSINKDDTFDVTEISIEAKF